MIENDLDNYKMAMIPNNGHLELEEGETKYFGNTNFYILHDYTFREFCKKYSPEILTKPGIKKDSPAELYAYYLQEDGNIPIANLTHSSTIEKYGKEAMIFMPENPSEKQHKSLEALMDECSEYTFFILYDFKLVDNYPMSKNIFQTKEEKPIDLLNRYFENTNTSTKK